jgi:hypothetical protein
MLLYVTYGVYLHIPRVISILKLLRLTSFDTIFSHREGLVVLMRKDREIQYLVRLFGSSKILIKKDNDE